MKRSTMGPGKREADPTDRGTIGLQRVSQESYKTIAARLVGDKFLPRGTGARVSHHCSHRWQRPDILCVRHHSRRGPRRLY
jgi:hypothetical protein